MVRGQIDRDQFVASPGIGTTGRCRHLHGPTSHVRPTTTTVYYMAGAVVAAAAGGGGGVEKGRQGKALQESIGGIVFPGRILAKPLLGIILRAKWQLLFGGVGVGVGEFPYIRL